MALCRLGIGVPIASSEVKILVDQHHPLIILANHLPWEEMAYLVFEDLRKSTLAGRFSVGRKLKLRIHLGVYILRVLFQKTYRQIERDLLDNAVYQAFCGITVVDKFHVPDHTKIYHFESRLTLKTKRRLANLIAQVGEHYGYCNPEEMDLDSTVQKAHIANPSEIMLGIKLAEKIKKITEFVYKEIPERKSLRLPPIQLGKLRGMAKYYFFYGDGAYNIKAKVLIEIKNQIMLSFIYVSYLKNMLLSSQKELESYSHKVHQRFMDFGQIQIHAMRFLENINYFLKHRSGQKKRLLSWHISEVGYFVKGRFPKMKTTCGRQYQIARLGGNYLLVGDSENSIRVPDAQNVIPMVKLHGDLFGPETLKSFASDRGYYSSKNEEFLENKDSVEKYYLPRRGERDPSLEDGARQLSYRRSGVEAMIGHAKHGGGLGQSRAKTDSGMLSEGYESIFAVNLRQFMRHLVGETFLAGSVKKRASKYFLNGNDMIGIDLPISP